MIEHRTVQLLDEHGLAEPILTHCLFFGACASVAMGVLRGSI